MREPLLSGVDIESTGRLVAHRCILENKPLVREVFLEIHLLMWELSRTFLSGEGLEVEIGSGACPLKLSYPSVISTDLVPSPMLDRVLDAQQMNLPDESVRTVFGQHTFHHLPEPEKFLLELRRVLMTGGGAVLVEPYWGPMAALLFSRLFREEGYDKNAMTWNTAVSGAMSGANQALSYIVFERDKVSYAARFPDLPIVYQAPLGNYLRYLLSGGLNFRQLVPSGSSSVLQTVEKLLSPFNKWLSLHHVLVLKKL